MKIRYSSLNLILRDGHHFIPSGPPPNHPTEKCVMGSLISKIKGFRVKARGSFIRLVAYKMSGFEAVPTVEHTIAWTKYRSGRTEGVKMMIKSLDENYSDSVFRVMSPGGPRLMTGEEAIDRIDRATSIGEVTEK